MNIMRLMVAVTLIVYFNFRTSTAISDKLRIAACDNNNRRIIAAHITSDNVRGKLECYFEPKSGEYMFRIRINKLDLKPEGTQCPSVRFIGFTSKQKIPEDSEDWRQPDKAIMAPADPQTLKSFDCKNYKSATGLIFETTSVGQKIVFEYDTKNTNVDRLGDVDFIITSYISGPSNQCPKNHFNCWSSRHICIDSSIECDEVDNCYDNSDEDNFRCSGKILGIVLPLFIIIIVLVLIFLIGIVIIVILLYRRRRNRIGKNVAGQVTTFSGTNDGMPYYLPSRPVHYSQTPPEVKADRNLWQQEQQQQRQKQQQANDGTPPPFYAYDNSAQC